MHIFIQYVTLNRNTFDVVIAFDPRKELILFDFCCKVMDSFQNTLLIYRQDFF